MSEIQEWKDWRIDKQLGAGSFGKVYRAVREDDYGNTYEAALKIIHIPQNEEEYETMRKDMMDDDSVTTYYKSLIEDLVKEIVTMSRLRGNSTIVSYMDHEVIAHKDSFGWDIYINMELLTPLHKYIRENPLTEVDVVSLGVDICKALVVCDKFHIIHRDIKPENIFVSDTGRFKLGDFGIARQLDKTTSGLSKKGTYMYMAPEVERQQTYNKTVDMYSLGLVLYWFMNGYRHPFFPPADKPIRPSDRQESLVKRLRGDEIPAPAMASEKFARIILKACAFDPKDRYADAAAMQEELEDLRDEMRAAQKAAPGEAEHTEILTVPLREGTGTNGTGAAPGTGSGTGGVFGTGNGTANDTGGGLSGTGGGTGNGTGSPPGYVPQQQEPSEPSISPPPKQESGTRPDYSAPAPAPAPVKQKRRSKKKIIIAACVGVVVLIIAAKLLFGGGGSDSGGGLLSSTVTIPDVTGQDITSARESLDMIGLTSSASFEYSDEIEKNAVISQDMAAGESVPGGTKLRLVVSKGRTVSVPKVKGKTKDNAKKALKKAGLKLKVRGKKWSDKVKKGKVISQKNAPKKTVEKGAVIYVWLSKGVEQVKVPNVVGKTQAQAEKKLKKAKLKVSVSQDYSSNVAAGSVISQGTAPKKKVDKNSKISIVVSLGPKPVVRTPSSSGSSSSGARNNSGSSNRTYSNRTYTRPSTPAPSSGGHTSSPKPNYGGSSDSDW